MNSVKKRRNTLLEKVPFDRFVRPRDVGGGRKSKVAHDLRALYHAGCVERYRGIGETNWKYQRVK